MKAQRALACLLGGIGCSHGSETQALGEHAEAIIAGDASGRDDDGVVLLRAKLEDEPEVLCSGSLVAPNLVLTARHCVSRLTPGNFLCTVRGELIDNPEGGGALGAHLPAESLEIYSAETPRQAPLARGKQVISTLAPGICINDLAFIVLDSPLELPIVPLRLSRPALVGEDTTLVGYGLIEKQTVLDYRNQPRARKSGLLLADVGPDAVEDGVITVPPRALIIRGPAGCVGDSGGPLLASSSGAVLGVYSLLAGASCTQANVKHQLVHVAPFQALIAEAFAAAEATPTPEPEPEPGSGGAAGAPSAEAGAESSAGAPPTSEPGDTENYVGSSCALSAPSNGSPVWPLLLSLLGGFRRRPRRRA